MVAASRERSPNGTGSPPCLERTVAERNWVPTLRLRDALARGTTYSYYLSLFHTYLRTGTYIRPSRGELARKPRAFCLDSIFNSIFETGTFYESGVGEGTGWFESVYCRGMCIGCWVPGAGSCASREVVDRDRCSLLVCVLSLLCSALLTCVSYRVCRRGCSRRRRRVLRHAGVSPRMGRRRVGWGVGRRWYT